MSNPLVIEVRSTFTFLTICTVVMLTSQHSFPRPLQVLFGGCVAKTDAHYDPAPQRASIGNLSMWTMSEAISIVCLVMIPIPVLATNAPAFAAAYACGVECASRERPCSSFGFLPSWLGSKSGARFFSEPDRGIIVDQAVLPIVWLKVPQAQVQILKIAAVPKAVRCLWHGRVAVNYQRVVCLWNQAHPYHEMAIEVHDHTWLGKTVTRKANSDLGWVVAWSKGDW